MKLKSLVLAALAGLSMVMLGSGVAHARVTAPSNTTPTTPDTACWGRSGAEVCVDRSGNILPTTTNNQTSGMSSFRWSTGYWVNGDFSGNLTFGDAASDRVTVNAATWTVPTAGIVFSTTTDGSGRDTLAIPGTTWWETGTSTPTVPSTSYAGLAAITEATAELKAIDGAGNVTKISPHNPAGEWVFESENIYTGKKVKINMEKFIHRMEELTGEHFMDIVQGTTEGE